MAQDSDPVFPRFNLAFVLGASKTELEWQDGSSNQTGVVDSLGDGEVSETSIRLTTRYAHFKLPQQKAEFVAEDSGNGPEWA